MSSPDKPISPLDEGTSRRDQIDQENIKETTSEIIAMLDKLVPNAEATYLQSSGGLLRIGKMADGTVYLYGHHSSGNLRRQAEKIKEKIKEKTGVEISIE
ncbi:MAG: hypothetical protein PHS62_05375 [Patescibacteria group bacterium]|nr:hypothetical protein [Patescibacteria group bacterium]